VPIAPAITPATTPATTGAAERPESTAQ